MGRYSSSNKEECEGTWERARSASQERARERSRSGRGDSIIRYCFETLQVSIPLLSKLIYIIE